LPPLPAPLLLLLWLEPPPPLFLPPFLDSLSAFLSVALSSLPAFVASVSGDVSSTTSRQPMLFEAAAVPPGALLSAEHAAQGQLQSPDSWVLYKQCGQSWSSEELGTARGTTICMAGCAMSSVAMILKTRGVDVNPGTLNTWLKSHHGYAGGDELEWTAVNALSSKAKFLNMYRGKGSMSETKLIDASKAGHGIVVNVRNGGHWVLVTGHISGSTFRVNDPAFSLDSYTYADMSNFVEYE